MAWTATDTTKTSPNGNQLYFLDEGDGNPSETTSMESLTNQETVLQLSIDDRQKRLNIVKDKKAAIQKTINT